MYEFVKLHNSLQGIFITMIGFVTWPPLQKMMVQKGGQVTKPIIAVKMPCKLLYVIQERISNFLISKFLVAYQ